MMSSSVSLGFLHLLCLVSAVFSQTAAPRLQRQQQQLQQPYSTPVPILQQINRQNEDGSYTYGYKNADGSYKLETKSAAGEIEGVYGYIDETGNQREIKYGASSSRGFEPAGPGITVPPPTLHVQNSNAIEDYDDGQYREDPSIYDKTEKPLGPKIAFKSPPRQPLPAANFRYESAPQQQQPLQYNQQPAQYNWYRSDSPAPAPAYNPALFQGHPATNFDPYTGSYTINYSG